MNVCAYIIFFNVWFKNENVELKQELTKSNSQVSSLMANQFKFSQQVNLVTSMLNSLQG